ncbi:MogA/MoaB family molybdenum cofactor biosynthesis protein [Natrinema salsiterrestre]|uniref:Molybdopterin-binding protein n=1 Tax=Natrinema salsiterrestre TaxID=2950540 RepID=A0A9Q4KZQ5_9EURY|nr:molybdopterin-binding protein [Natrinema salsiterrestre]MDF9744789.1 molybdopterin-binding protein [Natrinema salsiterrestre]
MNETDAGDETTASASETLCTGVVTIASDRSLETDDSGAEITSALEAGGHEITVREHVVPDHDNVQSIVSRLIDRTDVDVVITAGATGVEPTDITIEAVDPLLEKDLDTFSELFTVLSHEQVGTSALTTRTLAGITDGTLVFCLPGRADAVRLALEEIILSEAPELIELARGDEPDVEVGQGGEDSEDGDANPTETDAADGGV